MAPELVAGGGYGGLIREKPHCALVRNLHQCHEARHGGAQPGAKAYRIVVDSADGPAILNPVNWPAGLRVRAWPGQHTRPF